MKTEELIALLTSRKMKISTAESCTGGLIAQIITSIAGASAVFDCGIIAYSNKIKESILGVSAKTLSEFGAVSKQTAAEMAQGVLALSGADVAVSVTGIAGPGGGSVDKPVGTVFIGISSGSKTEVKKFLFKGDRESVRNQTAAAAIDMVIANLQDSF
ncbi:MAG: CinA family protein [Eubacteriales bacterium]|mgnify:CR=1 FL=1|nr:CinA family protein [Eubacteriales bacterium]